MQETPEYESPARTMPQATQEESEYQVEIGSNSTLSIPPTRYVYVVFEESRQRHMPSSPKILDRGRFVWREKIYWQTDIEQERQPDSHVRVTTEIKV